MSRPNKSIGTRAYTWGSGDVVTVSGTSAQSPTFGAEEVMISSTTACWITVGTNPTAAANTDDNFYFPANFVFHFRINPNSDKIAVIQASAGGYLSIVPVA